MPPNRYINIHSHHPDPRKEVLTITNKHSHFDQPDSTDFCSMGLHPWYLTDPAAQMKALKQYSPLPGVLAIGECGLDALCRTDRTLQQDVFRQQIAWANELGKPLIIHCVRAYPEVLALLTKATVPVIFHGFNRKLSLAKELLRQGYYLSFGAILLRGEAVIHAVFEEVPQQYFFLETDTAEAGIDSLYKAAARIRKTDEDALILQLQQNFKKVFGI